MLHIPQSYTSRVACQVPFTHELCPTEQQPLATVASMATSDAAWKRRIGKRLRELRDAEKWSLSEVEQRVQGKLSKSRLGNYEQGTRLIGLAESQLLADLYGVPSFYILCLEGDDDMLVLDKSEQQLIKDYRTLPERDRAEYARRIAALANVYRDPVADERTASYQTAPTKTQSR